jgi:hypothetical protein
MCETNPIWGGVSSWKFEVSSRTGESSAPNKANFGPGGRRGKGLAGKELW